MLLVTLRAICCCLPLDEVRPDGHCIIGARVANKGEFLTGRNSSDHGAAAGHRKVARSVDVVLLGRHEGANGAQSFTAMSMASLGCPWEVSCGGWAPTKLGGAGILRVRVGELLLVPVRGGIER